MLLGVFVIVIGVIVWPHHGQILTIGGSGGSLPVAGQVQFRTTDIDNTGNGAQNWRYGLEVDLTCATPHSSIYYTYAKNPSDPTVKSREFSGLFGLVSTVSVKAICTAPGYQNGPVSTSPIYTVAASTTFSLASGLYNTPQTVSLSCPDASATPYYSINGFPSTEDPATAYSAPIQIKHSEIILAICSIPGGFPSPSTGASYFIAPAATSTPTVQFTVDPAEAGNTIPPNFLGFVFPNSSLAQSWFSGGASTTNLLNLVKNLGTGTFRVGGDQEVTYWSRDPNATFPDAKVLLNPSDVDAYFSFAKQTGWKTIFGVNFLADLPSMVADEISYINQIAAGNVLAYEIGNEPDGLIVHGLKPASYTFSDYLNEFGSYVSAIHAAVPNAPLAGPVTSGGTKIPGGTATWLTSFLQDESTTISDAIIHFYPLGVEGPAILNPALVSITETRNNLAIDAQEAKQDGLPIFIDESNIEQNGPAYNSDANTYMGALWATDYFFTLVNDGYNGVDLEGQFGACASPGLGDSTLCTDQNDNLTGGPIYYAMLLFHYVGQGRMVPVNFSTSQNVTAYGVLANNGNLNVILVNKNPIEAINAAIDPGGTYMGGMVQRLEAPSLLSITGATFAGSAVNSNGTWTPGAGQTISANNGRYTVNLPAASAAVISFSK
jgi:hypothetical protein